MNDIIFSEWQFVTVFFSIIALLAMIVGRYPIKTTIISGIIACLANFAIVSFFIYLNVSTEQTQPDTEITAPREEVDIEQRLHEVFEENKERATNKELVALVEPISEKENVVTHVYVKNFHDKWAFNGKVRVAIFDDNDEVIKDEVFDISLDPGETEQIDSDFGDPHFNWFRYEFYPGETSQ